MKFNLNALQSSSKKALIFITNILVFMFMRHRLVEHLKLLAIMVVLVALLICAPLAAVLKFNLMSLSSEPWPVVNWSSNLLNSFHDIHKVSFICITYLAALLVHHLAEEMITYQTKRDQIPKNKLTKELRANTRAVVITMSNALSLVFKSFICLSFVLAVFIYFGGDEAKGYIDSTLSDIFGTVAVFIIFDVFIYIIQRVLLLENKNPEDKCAEKYAN